MSHACDHCGLTCTAADSEDHDIASKVIAVHQVRHEQDGSTLALHFPSRCPWDVYLKLSGQIAQLVYAAEHGWIVDITEVGGQPPTPDREIAMGVLTALREKMNAPSPPGTCTQCGEEVTDWPAHRNMHFTEDTAHWNEP